MAQYRQQCGGGERQAPESSGVNGAVILHRAKRCLLAGWRYAAGNKSSFVITGLIWQLLPYAGGGSLAGALERWMKSLRDAWVG